MTYYSGVLYIDDSLAVAFRHVESMRFPDGELLTVDILRDDLHLEIITASGREYQVSMKYLKGRLESLRDSSIRDIRNEIYYKWIRTMEGK